MTLLYLTFLTLPSAYVMISISLEGLVNPTFGQAMRRIEQLSSRLPLDSCASQPSPDKDAQSLEAQEPGGNFDSLDWSVRDRVCGPTPEPKTQRRCPMQNLLPQTEIRQVLNPDAVAHPQRMKAGAEVEVNAIFPHGFDGDSNGWIAQFFYNGERGCCDPRNLLKPAMYEMLRGWEALQERLDYLPSYERTAVVLGILDDIENFQFDPTMSAILLSSLLSSVRR
jgi:hypothetical protein